MKNIYIKELKILGFELGESPNWEVWYKIYEDFEIEASKRINDNSDLYFVYIKTLSKPTDSIPLGARNLQWLLELNHVLDPPKLATNSNYPDLYEEKVNKEGRDGCGRE